MIWRNFAAGLKVWAEPFVHVQHGRDEATGYQTGTALEDASGDFAAEVARSRNELYYKRKWGANATTWASISRVQRMCCSRDTTQLLLLVERKQGEGVWRRGAG